MEAKHAGPMDGLLDGLIERGTIRELIGQPEPVFNVALERIRRAHLERQGFVYQDPHNPATCESCEG